MTIPSDPASDNWEHEIRSLEEKNRLAFLNADIPTLEALWSKDFAVNSPLNKVFIHPQTLDSLRTGRIRHLSMEVDIEHIHRHGDTVIVMGHDRVTDPPDGTLSHRRFTNIWQLQDGKWRAIARHANIISREPPPLKR